MVKRQYFVIRVNQIYEISCIFHESSIPLLTLPQRLLRQLALGDVAEIDNDTSHCSIIEKVLAYCFNRTPNNLIIIMLY